MNKFFLFIILLTLGQSLFAQESESEETFDCSVEFESEILPAPDSASDRPHNERGQSKSLFQEREVSRSRRPVRRILKGKNLRKYMSDDTISVLFLASGAILAFLAIFLPILFLWIGGWAFLIAAGTMAIGLTLIALSGNFSGPVERFGIAMAFWGLLLIDIIALAIWAIIGAIIWW